MSTPGIRQELHQYIDSADEKVLQILYTLFIEENKLTEQDFELTPEQKKILDERLEVLEKNPEDGSPWKEVKQRILNAI